MWAFPIFSLLLERIMTVNIIFVDNPLIAPSNAWLSGRARRLPAAVASCLLAYCCCMAVNPAAAGAPLLIDRAVLQVGRTVYTQQNLEWYLLCKALLNAEPPSFDDFQAELRSRWPRYLESFESDLLVLEETQRTDSFLPDAETYGKAKDFLYARINSSPLYARWVRDAELDETAISQSLNRILQVEGFRQGKQRVSRQSSGPERAGVDWEHELAGRTAIKRFEGALVFQPLKKIKGD